jgi:hypothetical protein
VGFASLSGAVGLSGVGLSCRVGWFVFFLFTLLIKIMAKLLPFLPKKLNVNGVTNRYIQTNPFIYTHGSRPEHTYRSQSRPDQIDGMAMRIHMRSMLQI